MPGEVNRTDLAMQEAVKTATSMAVDPFPADQFGEECPATADPAPSAAHRSWRVSGQRRLRAWFSRRREEAPLAPLALPEGAVIEPRIELPADDPLAGYLMHVARAVDVRELGFESPAVKALKDAGVVLVVPLISAGTPIGMLSLGPRLSERDYSTDDRRLLNSLAKYAAPAIRVGQLVREQQAEALRRERVDQQLKVARIIQHQFLPTEQPDLPGWQVTAFYRPALMVGGDIYDFIPLSGGRVMVGHGGDRRRH